MKFVTRKQLSSAHALACAYAHDWARLPVAALDAALARGIQPSEVDQEAGAGAERARLREGRPSVWSPAGVSPSPSHTTGTGRLAWAVRPSGEVEAVVYRPDPSAAAATGTAVLEALFAADGRLLVARLRSRGAVRAEQRHVEALAKVGSALGADGSSQAIVVACDDDHLSAALAATEEAREASEDAGDEVTQAVGLHAFAALQDLDDRVWAGDELSPEQAERRAALRAQVDRAFREREEVRSATFERVYRASYAARWKALRAQREADPRAAEKRYQAARAAELARCGVEP